MTPAQACRPLIDKYDATDRRPKQIDIYPLLEERGLPLVDV